MDAHDPSLVDTIRFYGNRFCYVPGLHKLYGCCNRLGPPPWPGDCILRVLDTQSDSVTATFYGPRQVSGMCLDRTGNYIYCAVYGDTMMFVIDVRGDSVLTMFPVPTQAAPRDPLAADRNTNRIYEAQYFADFGIGIPVIRDSILVGLEELGPSEAPPKARQTILRRGVPLSTNQPACLYDATGRVVATLCPGLNDISRAVPGIYFVRERSATTKVVIPR
jgi:hypothetical protein